MTQKLKESREEGLQIRADCQAMIKQYQVRFQCCCCFSSLLDDCVQVCMYNISVSSTPLPVSPTPQFFLVLRVSTFISLTVLKMGINTVVLGGIIFTYIWYLGYVYFCQGLIIIIDTSVWFPSGIRRNEIKFLGQQTQSKGGGIEKAWARNCRSGWGMVSLVQHFEQAVAF